ncbi:NAD-dependent deacetylase sirtuin-2 [Jaminaea rosea]|uniref:protein acetyllysine N-acetyltransferase n=1 Tax=Jaminaea rosea TaxID=1569628 RepID=A0A316UIS3_9BASI|nr:NAD-dependent deacetylase sirtuin-2 [Jaminaea rosea]PWN25166.1 NAD-dependent deacetylase sirtuin-2 [Jaminaea rosea]
MASSRSPLSQHAPSPTSPPDLASIAKHLSLPTTKKVVVLCGAGISTTAQRISSSGQILNEGIPDFRSPSTGLYANLSKYNLPYPEAIFEIGFFQSNPQPFFTLAQSLYPGQFLPSKTHYFLSLLAKKGKLLRCFTQNIDTLERRAGLKDEDIVEAHGSFATASCTRCGVKVDPDWMREKCMKGEVARCTSPKCSGGAKGKDGKHQGALVKNDIVFFGEGLPTRFFERLGDLRQADLLIVLGTSLQVQPFASLIDRVPASCPRVLLNLERVGDIGGEEDGDGASWMSSRFRESGFDFDGLALPRGAKKSEIRDVFWKGKTDEGVESLAKEMGWEAELKELIEEGTKKAVEEAKAASAGAGVAKATPSDEVGTEKEARAVAAKVVEGGEHVADKEQGDRKEASASLGDENAMAEAKGRADESKNEADDLAGEVARKLDVKGDKSVDGSGEDGKKSSL